LWIGGEKININEFKSYLESYYKKNNIFEIFLLTQKVTVKRSERINKFIEFVYTFNLSFLNENIAEELIKECNVAEKYKFADFILKYKDIDVIKIDYAELFDYISELSQEIYANTMIISVPMATKWKLHPPMGTLITRNDYGDLYFDNKQILEISTNAVKGMSNKIIIYNSDRFIWKTRGLSGNITELKEEKYKVILRSFHEFKIKSKYIKIINLID